MGTLIIARIINPIYKYQHGQVKQLLLENLTCFNEFKPIYSRAK